MAQNFQEELAVHLSVRNRRDYQSDKVNKGIVSIGSNRTLRDSGHPQYMEARVNKLRELYEQCEPQYEYYYQLPQGETDGRKSIRMEKIIGEDISPFDLPNFEELMPKKEDFLDKYSE